MSAKEAKEAGYICHQCADANGGVWPDGHCATFHGGVCPMCGKGKSLAAWDDWNWPDSQLEQEAKDTREV